MGSRDWYWGGHNPSWQVCMQKSLFGVRLHNAWIETTQQRGRASQDPTLQLPDSTFTDLNSHPSLLSPQKNLHVQALSRTYGKLPVSSCSILTPLSILEYSPCTSSHICSYSCCRASAAGGGARLLLETLVSSICPWFHCQTCATWHQLWWLYDMSNIPNVVGN